MKEELGECLRVTFSILGRVGEGTGEGILRSHYHCTYESSRRLVGGARIAEAD